MKLKFKIEKRTDLELKNLTDRIISHLTDSKYKILDRTNYEVAFDDSNTPVWSSNAKKFTRVDSGIFEILKLHNQDVVILTYYISIIGEIIMIVVLALIGLFYDDVILLYSLFVLLFSLLRLQIVYSNSKEIVNKITDPIS